MHDMIREKLISQVDEKYRDFTRRLLPDHDNILGVRLPMLRKMAREIAQGNWREFLDHAQDEYFEEVMLQAMVIGYVRSDLDQILPYVAWFVPKIDNWSVCDSFCAGLKIAHHYKNEMWDFIQPYFQSERAFDVRFAVVMVLSYFVDSEYVQKAFHLFNSIQHEDYYVKTAVAWAVSTYFSKIPEETMSYLKKNTLDDFTYNKALQKIVESAVSNERIKSEIRSMKRK